MQSLCYENQFSFILKLDYHNKNFALRLTLKERLRGIRPILTWPHDQLFCRIFVRRYYSHPIVWKKVMSVLSLKKQGKEILNYGWRRKEFFNIDLLLFVFVNIF